MKGDEAQVKLTAFAMIVQCDKCTTRFRIADEKITGNGVKVRCSRCAHVFVVSPPTTTTPTQASPTGPSKQNTGRVDPSVMSALVASTVPSFPGDANKPVARARSGLASSHAAAAQLGFGVNPDANTDPLAIPGALRQQPPSGPSSTPNVESSSLGPGLDSSDFSDLDEAFRRALAESSDLGSKPMPRATSDIPTPIIPLSVGGAARGPSGLGAARLNSGADLAPLPMSAIERPLAPSSGDFGPGNTPTRSYSDVDEASELIGALYEHGPRSTTGDRFPPPVASMVDDAPSNGDRFPPTVKPETRFPPPSPEAFRAAAQGPSDSGDIPGLLAPTDDDPFANIDVGANANLDTMGPLSSASDLLPDLERPRHVFDEAEPVSAPPRSRSEPFARLELTPAGPDLSAQRASHEATAVVQTYVATSNLPMPDDGRWPTLAGILLGLVALVFLMPDLGQRAVEAVLPEQWDVNWTGAVSPTPVQVNRPKATAYPTQDGRQLLVVAGDARNRTSLSLVGVEVVVRVFRGGKALDERRAMVNIVLNEGQLASIADADGIAEAYRDAITAHGARGVVLPPNAERPFMVVFPSVPDHAASLRYEISFDVPKQWPNRS